MVIAGAECEDKSCACRGLIGQIKPERALNAFKAYATRRMRRDGNWQVSHSPWADMGSKRSLWNERSVALAIDYVINGQGGELPEFD